jgi:hypothetical protein
LINPALSFVFFMDSQPQFSENPLAFGEVPGCGTSSMVEADDSLVYVEDEG